MTLPDGTFAVPIASPIIAIQSSHIVSMAFAPNPHISSIDCPAAHSTA